jgi:hypothetical protein
MNRICTFAASSSKRRGSLAIVPDLRFAPAGLRATGESGARMVLFVVARLCQAWFAAVDWAGDVEEPMMDFSERKS